MTSFKSNIYQVYYNIQKIATEYKKKNKGRNTLWKKW
jgi:hypothetical protein